VSGYSKTLNDQSGDRFQTRASMNDVAEQTGGEVFADTNDLSRAIARSINDGANYYTVAYAPTANESDENFRSIEVTVNKNDVRLAYRRGYYPKPKAGTTPQSPVRALASAMLPGSPASTMLLVTAQVLPPDESHKTTRLDYKIDLNGIEFADAPDGLRHALIDCMAIAFDSKGNDVGSVANTVGITLNENEYQAVLRSGASVNQEINLPPGSYQLRIGVMDRMSEKVGTVDAPLVITSQSATKN
jgi:hypothetical protein